MATNGCRIGYKNDNCLVDRNNREVKRFKKIIQNSALSLAELSGRIRLASQHALAETFVFPRRQTVKLFAAPLAAATLNPRNNSLSN
jgi:hypothetical protein